MNKLVRCGGFLAILIAGTLALGYLSRPDEIDKRNEFVNVFNSMPKDTIEFITFGSSRAYASINVEYMYEEYGIGGFNYGMSWQNMNTTDLFIHDALEEQTPKVILIETFKADSILEDVGVENGEIVYTRPLSNSVNKFAYLKEVFGSDISKYCSYVFPILEWHDNFANINEDSFQNNVDVQRYYVEKRLGSMNGITEISIPDQTDVEQLEFSEESIAILDDIVSTCKKKNVDIIFYTTPYAGEYSYADAMSEYASSNGYVYFNFFDKMDELGMNESIDFSDESHLNSAGAEKVSDYLAKYITENYDMTDMREIEGNIWEN